MRKTENTPGFTMGTYPYPMGFVSSLKIPFKFPKKEAIFQIIRCFHLSLTGLQEKIYFTEKIQVKIME